MADKTQNQEKNGKSKVVVAILAIVGILVVGGGAFGGYMLFESKKASKAQVNEQRVQQSTQQAQVQQGIAMQPVVPKKTFDLDEFLVNLGDEGGSRFIKTKISLGYDEKKLDKELPEKKPLLRDAIISVLRSKKAKDINNPKSVDQIKIDIINKINPVLEKGRVITIYFDDLLVQ